MYKHKLTLSTEALRKGGKPANALFAERERELFATNIVKKGACLVKNLHTFYRQVISILAIGVLKVANKLIYQLSNDQYTNDQNKRGHAKYKLKRTFKLQFW